MIKKIIISFIIVFLIWAVKFSVEMYDLSKGLQKDIHKNIEFYEKNTTPAMSVIVNVERLDTIDGDNFNILFFNPSTDEFDKLIDSLGENSGLNEVDSDFSYYGNKIIDSLSKTKMRIKVVTERIIKLRYNNEINYFDRIQNEKGQYGVIFNYSNCEPLINFGIMTDVGIYQELEAYRKNCK